MPDWGTGFGIIMSRQILVCGVMAVKLAVLLNTEGVGPTSKELAVVTKDVVATMATTARVDADGAQQHVLVGGIGIVWPCNLQSVVLRADTKGGDGDQLLINEHHDMLLFVI
jgi:hypothetical protein